MRLLRTTLAALLPAVALAVAVPGTAHAAGTYRNDDGTRETEVRIDDGDGGRDSAATSIVLPPNHVYGATAATLWVYAKATGCDTEGAGHRLTMRHGFHWIDYDPCDLWPTTGYAWHGFPVPLSQLLDGSPNFVSVEDRDGRIPPLGEVGPALTSGRDAYYGIDTSNTGSNVSQTDASGVRRIAGELMWYLELTGTVPYAALTPGALEFPVRDIGTTSPAQTVTVRNRGLASMPVSVSFGGPAAAEYAVVSNTCGTLVPNATCTFGVTFTPGAAGSRHAQAVVSGGDAVPQAVELNGEATAPPPVSTITTAGGTFLLPGDSIAGTATGTSDVVREYVEFDPAVPGLPVTTVLATLSCGTPTTCTWQVDPLVYPGPYTVRAYGVDRQGNVESPGPSVEVTVV